MVVTVQLHYKDVFRKVEGSVKKGDIMVASDVKGHAAVWTGEGDPRCTAYIGIAIADGEGMVEVKVGK